MPDQMRAGVMNSHYTSEELLSLIESSDDGGRGLMIVVVSVMVKVIMDRWTMLLEGRSFQCLSQSLILNTLGLRRICCLFLLNSSRMLSLSMQCVVDRG